MTEKNYHKLVQKGIKILLLGFISIIVFLISINYYILSSSKDYIYESSDVSKNKIEVGLVLGASVLSNGEPSDILKDRLLTAIFQYQLGNIQKLIVSGDNSKKNYNEPQVMKNYLEKNGVDSKDIFLDYAGFDTYDSIYRAKEIFGVNSLIIFTQKYHLYRSIFIARGLNIDAVGVISDRKVYLGINRFKTREFFSRIKAFLEVKILKTQPKFLGEKIKIK